MNALRKFLLSAMALSICAAGPVSGPLILSGPPTVTNGAATKGYVDGSTATSVPLAGGTMSGPLILSGAPTVTNGAATKGYVDTTVASIPGLPSVLNLASLRAYSGVSALADGALLGMAGYSAQNDGGGGLFLWSASSTAADDGILTINPTGNAGAGRFLRYTLGSTINALWAGADRTGVADSTAAEQAALAMGHSVYNPWGSYRLTNSLTWSHGGCLYGDGQQTQFSISSDFNASAIGVLLPTGRELASPCIHDLAITGAQPANGAAAAYNTWAIGSTSIRISTNAPVRVGDYITDTTLSGAIVWQTTITSVSAGSGYYQVGLSVPTVSQVTAGDNIALSASRPTFAALGTCTVTNGGTGCKYPWAINYNSQANRGQIYNIYGGGLWDGFELGNSGGTFLHDIQMGALDIGLHIDGALDFVHVRAWHHWNFALGQLLQTYEDGAMTAASFGRVDGLSLSDFTALSANVHLLSTASASADPFSFESFKLDGGALNIDNVGQLLVSDFSIATGTINRYQMTINAGHVTMKSGIITGYVSGVSGSVFMNGSAAVNLSDVYMVNENPGAYVIDIDGATVALHDNNIVGSHSSSCTAAYVHLHTGTMVAHDNTFGACGGGGRISYLVNGDSPLNFIRANATGNSPMSAPPGPFANGPAGTYEGTAAQSLHTVTLTTGDRQLLTDKTIKFTGSAAVAFAINGCGTNNVGAKGPTFLNKSTATATLTPDGGTINGAASYALSAGASVSFTCTGTDWE